MKKLEDVKGWLIDLEGTLHVGGVLVPGAAEFIRKLRDGGRHFRLISNSNVRSRRQIADELTELGISANPREIFTPSSAVAQLIGNFSGLKCYFLLSEDVMEEFAGIEVSDTNPDYVVMGDIGPGMNYDLLNKAFKLVMGGAELIALQKNRFFRDANGLHMDAGALVAALEFAANKQAKIIGKPSRQFFNLAVHDIRVEAGERWLSADFAIVGDDVESDIKGAMDAGLLSVLVKTGKYNGSYSEHHGIVPDWAFDSIKELAERMV